MTSSPCDHGNSHLVDLRHEAEYIPRDLIQHVQHEGAHIKVNVGVL